MARDGELPTIFHPKRVRTPSVIVTSDESRDSANGPGAGPGPGPLSPRAPLTTQGSVSSAPSLTCSAQPTLHHLYSESAASSQDEEHVGLREGGCRPACCSTFAKKMYYGVGVTVVMTVSWVVATHCIKYLYLEQYTSQGYGEQLNTRASLHAYKNYTANSRQHNLYNAPFFTAWFCTCWLVLVYPLYACAALAVSGCRADLLADPLRDFREKGFTFARFISRCGLFSMLWVMSCYMHVYSLKILLATDVAALFATNVSCVYLLSWVILHEQFVGVRIVAAIMCDTGIALLAYMDGITGSSTLGGVVLAAFAAAGFAIFKVVMMKVVGEVQGSGRAVFLSLVGALNLALVWPVWAALYLAGAEMLPTHSLPWLALVAAASALLVFNVVYHFGDAVTYNMFVTLGFITSVPVSAALDVLLYEAQFEGMKLAGVILIGVGFFLVMFPDNWPDYIMRLLRWSRRHRGVNTGGVRTDATDFRTGYIRSHLRSPSGRVR